uniref:Uncharacterized protein n=1 Tax=Candidatus Kentrum sp. FW TaxID=2126338 RepID=A0A450SKB1_9GAMM|nr:MAG: hypothetical protein BECKFW1821B_GA0114236_101633 [Candidatus Kentron sp. FW]VFJ57349.1 MAG: hypothetical protein BECKFW1821A_GA0114235_10708 [Candidatus Kentron sp. FW]
MPARGHGWPANRISMAQALGKSGKGGFSGGVIESTASMMETTPVSPFAPNSRAIHGMRPIHFLFLRYWYYAGKSWNLLGTFQATADLHARRPDAMERK